jgi:heterodisulfide reductase subunit B
MSMTTHPDTGRVLSGKILKVAKARGADCVATACPLCQVNLEAYQDRVGQAVGADCHLAVLYFTQLMGSALGLSSKELALSDSLTPVEALLAGKVANR